MTIVKSNKISEIRVMLENDSLSINQQSYYSSDSYYGKWSYFFEV